MKNILSDIFTQRDNKTFSYMRIVVIPCLLMPFTYKLIVSGDSLRNISIACIIFGVGLGILAFFSKFIEENVISNIVKTLAEKTKP